MNHVKKNIGRIHEIERVVGIYVKDLAESAVRKRGIFTIALSGGSSMEILSQALLKREINEEIDWKKWHVFWVDERCVPADSPQSNYGRAREIFLDHVDIPENQIYPIKGTLAAMEALDDYERKISAMATGVEKDGFIKFDLVVLGLGQDGHIASLFPGHGGLKERKRMVTYIDDSPKEPRERISLTLPVIKSSRNVAFVVSGLAKASIIKEIFTGENPDIPASLVDTCHGHVEWFIDEEAGSDLY